MTARVYNCLEVERRRCQRARKRAAQEGGGVDHFAHLQGQFQASRDLDDSARVYCAEEGHVGGYLSQLPAGTLQGAAVYMGFVAAATATAALILHQTQALLTHAASLLSSNSLAGRDAQCLSTTTRTSVKRTTETFGDGAA
jgi:hypothetical protein